MGQESSDQCFHSRRNNTTSSAIRYTTFSIVLSGVCPIVYILGCKGVP